MTKKLIKQHDELSKKFLTDVDRAIDFLNLYLDPNIIAKCDLKTLTIEPCSYIDDSLNKSACDVLYKIDLKDRSNCVYIYVLIEHQSTADVLMPFRVLCYQIEIIKMHMAKYKTKAKLPLVVPLVFYNGKRSPYPYSTEINDLFEDKVLLNSVGGLGVFKLVDLTIMADSEILQHKQLALLEMCLKHIRMRDFSQAYDLILEALLVAQQNQLSPSMFHALVTYLANAREYAEVLPLFTKIANKFDDYRGDVMTYADTLIQQGRQEGIQEGRQEGRQELVKELLRYGIDEKVIVKASHLSEEEIEAIKKAGY